MKWILFALLVAIGVLVATIAVLSQTSLVGLDLRQYTRADESLDRFFEPTLVRAPSDHDQRELVEQREGNSRDDAWVLEGVVLDTADRPIARASVECYCPSSTDGWSSSWTVYTDASGVFRVTNLPRDQEGVTLAPEHPDFVPEQRIWPVRFGDRPVLRMQRAMSCTIDIEVVDDTSGDPVVSFRAFPEFVRPGAQPRSGHFEPDQAYDGRDGGLTIESFHFAEGSQVAVRIDALGMTHERDAYGSPNGVSEVAEDDLRSRSQSFVPVAGALHHLSFRVILDAPEREAGACVCSGTLVDARDGTPIRGADIIGFTPLRNVQSDVRGRFRIARDCGRESNVGKVKHPKYERLTPWPACDGELRMQPRGSLSGVALDAVGRPLVGASVRISTDEPVMLGPDNDGPFLTDDIGRFRITDLPAAEYCVSVAPPPRNYGDGSQVLYDAAYFVQRELPYLFTRTCVRVASGQNTEVRLERSPPDTVELRGVVRTSERLAVPIVPYFYGESRESGWIKSVLSPDGEYRTGAMRRGRYLVLLVSADDDIHEPVVALAPLMEVRGFAEQVVDFELPSESARGIVQGIAPSDVLRVIARPPESLTGPAGEMLESEKFARCFGVRLDDRGGFELNHLFPGRHRLEIRDGTRVLASREVDVSGPVDIGIWDVTQ